MSREVANELEERRVIRLLAGAAEAVPPLQELDVEEALSRAANRSRYRPAHGRSFSRQQLPLAALAAAVALAAVLPTRQQEPQVRPSSSPAGIEAHLAAFPEGSALSLLLARPAERRA